MVSASPLQSIPRELAKTFIKFTYKIKVEFYHEFYDESRYREETADILSDLMVCEVPNSQLTHVGITVQTISL